MAATEVAQVMLGKGPVKTDVRTLLLARYVDRTALPQPPASVDLTSGVAEWPMYANDTVGDCTCAAAGHMIEAWTEAARHDATVISEGQVLAAFDNVKQQGADGEWGAVELDVLNYWRKTGIGHHRIKAFARVSTYDHALVRTGTYLFGGVYIGLQLPLSAQQQSVWDWTGELTGPSEPGSWGGHAVDVVAYDADSLTVVTWGKLKQMTWAFWDRYCDEAYCLISSDFLNNGKTASGLDLKSLLADLALVTA
jgi:hypothetical protein